MDYEVMYPSRFIKAAEFGGKDYTLTIKAVKIEKLEGGDGKVKVKGIVSLKETDKEWLLNRTNGEALKLMFGRETNDWVGKRVTLFPQPMEFGGEDVIAIRVRGSPDIAEPLSAVIPRGRKVLRVNVKPTGKAPAKAAAKPVPVIEEPAATEADFAAELEQEAAELETR